MAMTLEPFYRINITAFFVVLNLLKSFDSSVCVTLAYSCILCFSLYDVTVLITVFLNGFSSR